ncbi:uracil-DNA glycosylase, family 4 [Thalassovita gelatinovora]|uniref:Uracil-DNA glycosylase, family 4 n=1 Tax=Thalassovita gelatinovora TaxID=53501 RepID=A0A0P1FCQ3_THAGE|nr:uracil-DNA glycosylase family protein [Thalassovita gelatinovora]QIZ80528.1 uracil-DNA glycosylase family protein [Thalassovita gelatinovora]CUH65996.1 uracil-DNA glycosylase, family 4 [Thalassovita gelatinovora]SEQ75180.1 uracil-DNA glycosylase, family 4 [Thalassovita gelatinovora]
MSLAKDIAACRICADRFAATATRHTPRPVPWFRPSARILIAGQAPGLRVHEAGKPFFDRSGDRLRDWLGLSQEEFYDLNLVACVPAAFCFPGYNAKRADLPPPPICAGTWQDKVMEELPALQLKILVGAYAHRNHLGEKGPLTETVQNWQRHAPGVFVLPHPSWRNTGWLRRNPWFEADLLPELKATIRSVMDQTQSNQQHSS